MILEWKIEFIVDPGQFANYDDIQYSRPFSFNLKVHDKIRIESRN